MSANVRDLYVEEVEFMLSCGCGDGEILRRLSVRPEALARALHRAGRSDLARPFWRISDRARREAAK